MPDFNVPKARPGFQFPVQRTTILNAEIPVFWWNQVDEFGDPKFVHADDVLADNHVLKQYAPPAIWLNENYPLICPRFLRVVIYAGSSGSTRGSAWANAATTLLASFKGAEDLNDGEVIFASVLVSPIAQNYPWISQLIPMSRYIDGANPPGFFGTDVVNVLIFQDFGLNSSYPASDTFNNLLLTSAAQATRAARYADDIRLAKLGYPWFRRYKTFIYYDAGALNPAEEALRYFQRFDPEEYDGGFLDGTYLLDPYNQITYVNDSSQNQSYPWITAGGVYVAPKTGLLYNLKTAITVNGENTSLLAEVNTHQQAQLQDACAQLADYGFTYGGEVFGGSMATIKAALNSWWELSL